MQVKDVGEFALIEMLAAVIGSGGRGRSNPPSDPSFRLRLAIGDDAAAWDGPAGARVMTTDTMVEGVHFELWNTSWRDLGWKALAVNLSDVAAMGCVPLYSVVTLGLREDLPVDGLVEMYGGLVDACGASGGAVVGGDVVRSPVFFVTVAMVGASMQAGAGGLPSDRLLTRSAASPGEQIAVTGHLGCAAGGLQMLQGSLRVDEKTANHLREAHNRPVARVAEGCVMVDEGVAAAIDVSDGLVDDLAKMCEASGVAAQIDSRKLPADEYLRSAFPDEWLGLALGGGEDYELVFTATPEVMDRVASRVETRVTVIGDVVKGPPRVEVLDPDGRPMSVEVGGWDHFR